MAWTLLSTHDDLDDALAALYRAAPDDAYELTAMSRGLDYQIARVYLSPSTADVYLAMHGDGEGREPVELTVMTVSDVLAVPHIAAGIDDAIAAMTGPDQSTPPVDRWHEDVLAEANDAEVIQARVLAASRTGRPAGDEADAAAVERRLRDRIEQARRELTRLAAVRVAHLQALLDARNNRHGAKVEVARLLGRSQQSLQEAMTADAARWDRLRAASRADA